MGKRLDLVEVRAANNVVPPGSARGLNLGTLSCHQSLLHHKYVCTSSSQFSYFWFIEISNRDPFYKLMSISYFLYKHGFSICKATIWILKIYFFLTSVLQFRFDY